ncbi:MAG: hypothetical protein J5781_01545 [Clostridia bacterium]|nr:hypothetical protein [Clostridia bacterium]
MPLDQREDLIDWSIHRKKLNAVLFDLASKVKVEWGTEVVCAICDEKSVKGLKINKEGTQTDVHGDLIVDACGVFSPARKSLPASFGIPDVDRKSVFYVKRVFYKAKAGVPFPTDTNKVYMKHIGQKGISWCIACDNGVVDVLIGRVGGMDENTFSEALDDLKKNNPILSDEQIGEGRVCTIPVRRPLSKFVANGYACIGDSACMTVPMIGSGIAASLLAASFLAEEINKTKSVSVETLWPYQVRVYGEFGAEHCAVETMKNWLLEQKDDDIHFFLTSGILRNEDLQRASVGKMLKLEFPDVLHKGWVGMRRPGLLLKTLGMLFAANKAKLAAKRIPKTYDEKKALAWQTKTDGNFS